MKSQNRVADTAMARLVSAVIGPEDQFADLCTVETVLTHLSDQDQTVLTNIAHRIAILECSEGSAKAEAALAEIVALLAGDRMPNA